MQTLSEIRSLLDSCGARPLKRLGQCFMIDRNIMTRLLEISGPGEGTTILEVGPGTGSLTEELLHRAGDAGRVVACEIDRKLAKMLRDRFADADNLCLIEGDIMATKHSICPRVLEMLAPGPAHMISNLPYNIATPLVAECLLESWRASVRSEPDAVQFDSLSFTVQREVADRFAARQGKDYGPISVIISLMGRISTGPVVPPGAFWPRPAVSSRIIRIDFDPGAAGSLESAESLQAILAQVFSQRRKKIGSAGTARGAAFDRGQLGRALAEAGVNPDARPDTIPPDAYLAVANSLASHR
jgi:16S rRNA (adenine1518-N6/adenine1519-N6)-dimethyltransferase